MAQRLMLSVLLAGTLLVQSVAAQDTAVRTTAPVASFNEIVSARLAENTWQAWQWQGFPDIYVIQFESYELQGEAFNRVAAYIEKYGQRGKMASWREIHYYLRQRGLSMENLYSAHDYRTADLARFYNAAEETGDQFSDAEWGVLQTLLELGLLAAGERGRWESTGDAAVLSIATRYQGDELPSSRVMGQRDRTFEAHALYHETRHGFYFTEPAYAEICRAYWNQVLSPRDRELFRLVLKSMDYDPADEELMINEWQSYLLTPTYAFVGAGAVTDALREIADGRRRPPNLTSAERGQFVGRGMVLAIDVERWMTDDLRAALGEQWDIPPVADVKNFRMGR